MSKLSWGKPRLFVKDLDVANSPWKELPTPVQDSTELQPTKGDKMEAPVEGGQNEDVMYKDTKYAIVYNIRKAKGRAIPLDYKNGMCGHHYALLLMPEDATNIGFYIEDSAVSVDDNFKCAEGAAWAIQHDAVAAASGNTVKWGTVTISGNSITFTETQPAEGVAAISPITETVVVLSGGAVLAAVTSNVAENPRTAHYYEFNPEIGETPTTAQLSEPALFRLTWDEEPVTGKVYYQLSTT